MDVIPNIMRAVSDLSAMDEPGERWVRPIGNRRGQVRNHFVVFLKPEVLNVRDGVRLEPVLQLVMSSLRAHDVKTGAIRVLNGPYLRRYHIMEAHYGVINRVSNLGEAALSQPTRKKLVAECEGAELPIFGGHQFLEEYPEISAFALNVLADSLGSKKIAGGKYFITPVVGGKRVVVLNPFHPAQLLHFTPPGRTIVVFECWSNRGWDEIRQQMTGSTDPARAEVGSIRRTLLDQKRKFGLSEVGMGTNGVHCSAGPLEAMAEYSRFFSDHVKKEVIRLEETPFGQLLAHHGVSEKGIGKLAKNPMLGKNGQANYAFNLTEEKDADVGADLLAMAMRAA